MELNVSEMSFSEVNALMRQTDDREITLNGCIGQRFLAAGTENMCGSAALRAMRSEPISTAL